MDHPWVEFWNKTAETLGVAAAMGFFGSAFMLFTTPEEHSMRRGLTVISAGQLLNFAATAFVHGYLGLSFFLAPFVGLACGLVGSFLLLAFIKFGQDHSGDVVGALVKKVTGKDASQETKP